MGQCGNVTGLADAILGNPDDTARVPQLRQGIVTAVSPLLVLVGAATTAQACRTLGSYAPTVGDTVSVLVISGDRLVLGSASTPTHPVVTASFGAGLATTLAPGSGPLTLTSPGVWFVSFDVDVNPTGSGFGYLNVYPSTFSNSTPIGSSLVTARHYEVASASLPRTNLPGMWVVTAPTAPYDVWLRQVTFAGQCAFNSIEARAWRLAGS